MHECDRRQTEDRPRYGEMSSNKRNRLRCKTRFCLKMETFSERLELQKRWSFCMKVHEVQLRRSFADKLIISAIYTRHQEGSKLSLHPTQRTKRVRLLFQMQASGDARKVRTKSNKHNRRMQLTQTTLRLGYKRCSLCPKNKHPNIFDCNLKTNYQILIILGKNIPDTTCHQMTI